MTDVIRVLIADDDASVRRALADIISSDPTLELVGEGKDADEAIQLAATHEPDVALLDVRMPAGGGPRAVKEIRRCCPGVRIVALSAFEDKGTVLKMLGAGAAGYLVKGTAGADQIVDALHRAVRGQSPLSAEVAAGVVDELTAHLERQERELDEIRGTFHRIRRALHGEQLEIVFQPIADLETGERLGFEALSRFRMEPQQPPDAWFRDAAAMGHRAELELVAARTAVGHIQHLPTGTYLSINLSPETVSSPKFRETFRAAPAERIVIEITEHAPVEDYNALNESLGWLRDRGARVAIDDAGAGFASLRHVLQVLPEFIKFDIDLTRSIDSDRGGRALAAALYTFAREIGADIIAEGIESEDEVAALRELGVRMGQGYLLMRPGPLSSVLG